MTENKKGQLAVQTGPKPETTLREQGCEPIMPKIGKFVTSYRENE